MGSGTGRKRTLRRAALCGAAAVGALGFGAAVVAQGDDGETAHGGAVAALHDASGSPIGTARFVARPGGMLRVTVDVGGLAPGFHGMHVHATGQCVAPFTSAGGHQKNAGESHGAHSGDLPPLLVLPDGSARARFETAAITLAEVLDAGGDGSALIIHAGRDNLANIPGHYHSHVPDASNPTLGPDATTLATGDSGTRAACGVVQRSRGHH